MKKRTIAAILFVILASFFAGALSNSDTISIIYDLRGQAILQRRNMAYFDGTTGIDAPIAAAYFRGRAEGLELAEVIVGQYTPVTPENP